MSTHDDPARELAELARQAHAWVQWIHDSGVDELPSEAPASELLSALADPAGAARRAPRAAPLGHGSMPRAAPPAGAVAARAADPAPAPPEPTPRPARPKLAPDERVRRLALVQEQVRGCTSCRLHAERTQTVFARGNPDAELMFVGEGPGADEDRLGAPFVGKAGQLLDRMIAAMGYQPDGVYIANVVKCRPPQNRKPEPDEVAACVGYLREQIELVGPQVIVALGATGVQGLLGSSIGITRMRGTWKLYKGKIPIMPTFHPAYLLRQPDKKREVWNDLQQVMKRLGKTPPAGKRR